MGLPSAWLRARVLWPHSASMRTEALFVPACICAHTAGARSEAKQTCLSQRVWWCHGFGKKDGRGGGEERERAHVCARVRVCDDTWARRLCR